MRRPLSPAQAVIHSRSRLRSSLKPRRRSVQITMWLHIERRAESGRGRREAQRAPRGRTAELRAAALKGIDLAGRRAEPNRAEPNRAQRRGAQAAGASAQQRGSGHIASVLRPPPPRCLPRRLPGAPPLAWEQLPLRALTLRLLPVSPSVSPSLSLPSLYLYLHLSPPLTVFFFSSPSSLSLPSIETKLHKILCI